MPTSEPAGLNEDQIRDQGKIFRKGNLTTYQMEINRVAGDIHVCVKSLDMLTQRRKLLDMSRQHLDEQGYQCKMKKSRLKYFGQTSETESVAKRPKYNKDMRLERITEIQEELTTVDKRINIKQKLLNQKIGERRFTECDSISEAMHKLQTRQKALRAELRLFEKKEKKAEWYQQKKAHPAPSDSSCSTGHSHSPSGASPSPPSRSPFSPPIFQGRSWYVHHGRPRRRQVSLSPECDHMYSPPYSCSDSSNPEPSHSHSPHLHHLFASRSRSSPPASKSSACGRSLFYSPAVRRRRICRSPPVNSKAMPSCSASNPPTSPSDRRARSAPCSSKITDAIGDDEYNSGDTVILSDDDDDAKSGYQVF